MNAPNPSRERRKPLGPDLTADNLIKALKHLESQLPNDADMQRSAASSAEVIVRYAKSAVEDPSLLLILFQRDLDLASTPGQIAFVQAALLGRRHGSLPRIDPTEQPLGDWRGCHWGAAIAAMVLLDPDLKPECQELLEDIAKHFPHCGHVSRAKRCIALATPRVRQQIPESAPRAPYAADPMTEGLKNILKGLQPPTNAPAADVEAPFKYDAELALAALARADGSMQTAFNSGLQDVLTSKGCGDQAGYLRACHVIACLLGHWTLQSCPPSVLNDDTGSIGLRRRSTPDGTLIEASFSLEDWERNQAAPSHGHARLAEAVSNLSFGEAHVTVPASGRRAHTERWLRAALLNLTAGDDALTHPAITIDLLEMVQRNGGFVADTLMAEALMCRARAARREHPLIPLAANPGFVNPVRRAAALGHFAAAAELAELELYEGGDTDDDALADLLDAAIDNGELRALHCSAVLEDRRASKSSDPRIARALIADADASFESYFARISTLAAGTRASLEARRNSLILGEHYLEGSGTPNLDRLREMHRRELSMIHLLTAASYREPYKDGLPLELLRYRGLYDSEKPFDRTALIAMLRLADLCRSSGSGAAEDFADQLVFLVNRNRTDDLGLLGAVEFGSLPVERQRPDIGPQAPDFALAAADRLRVLQGLVNSGHDRAYAALIRAVRTSPSEVVADVFGSTVDNAIETILGAVAPRQPHAAYRLAYHLLHRLCLTPPHSEDSAALADRVADAFAMALKGMRLEAFERDHLCVPGKLLAIAGAAIRLAADGLPSKSKGIAGTIRSYFGLRDRTPERERAEAAIERASAADGTSLYVLAQHSRIEELDSLPHWHRAFSEHQARSKDLRDRIIKRTDAVAADLEAIDAKCIAFVLKEDIRSQLARPGAVRETIANSTRRCGPVLTATDGRGVAIPGSSATGRLWESGWMSVAKITFRKSGRRGKVLMKIEGVRAPSGMKPLITRKDILACLAVVLIDSAETRDGTLVRRGPSLSLEPIHGLSGPPVPFYEKVFDPVWLGGAFGPTMYYCDRLLFINRSRSPLMSFHDPFGTSRDDPLWQPPQAWKSAASSGGISVGSMQRAFFTVLKPPEPAAGAGEEKGSPVARTATIRSGKPQVEGGDIIRDESTGREDRTLGALRARFHNARYAATMTERIEEVQSSFPEFARLTLLYNVMFAIADVPDLRTFLKDSTLLEEIVECRRASARRLWSRLRRGQDSPLVTSE